VLGVQNADLRKIQSAKEQQQPALPLPNRIADSSENAQRQGPAAGQGKQIGPIVQIGHGMHIDQRLDAQDLAAGDLQRKAEVVGRLGAEEQFRIED